MPDISTESADLRRPNRRPIKEVAGEVTKKIIGLNDQALPPPTFTSPKIGGAVGFLPEEPDVEQIKESGEDTRDIREIGGINAARFTTSESAVQVPELEHPFAAPPGWRRYWGLLRWEMLNTPDFILSPFCKHCNDEGLARSCTRIRHHTVCQTNHDGPCLYAISYKPHPAEDISILDVPGYSMRRVMRDRLAAVGTPLEIPTADTQRSVYIRHPPDPARAEKATPRQGPKIPEPRPTYSQVRGAYEEITEGVQRNLISEPGRLKATEFRMEHSSQRSAPAWVIDVNKFQHFGIPQSAAPPSPRLRNALMTSGPCYQGGSPGGLTMEYVLGGFCPRTDSPISTRRTGEDMTEYSRENETEEGEAHGSTIDESSEENS